MVAIRIRSFGGIAPRINPRYLSDSGAQVSENVDMTRAGALTPIREAEQLFQLPSAPNNDFYRTLHKYRGETSTDPEEWWLASTDDISFCDSQIIGDEYGLIYFTKDTDAALTTTTPFFAYSSNQPGGSVLPTSGTSVDIYGLSTSGTPYISLGVPGPQDAPTVNQPLEPDFDTTGLTQEFRTYVYTYVYKKAGREMESQPSPPSEAVGIWLTDDENNKTVDITFREASPSGEPLGLPPYDADYGVDFPIGMNINDLYIRVYRSVGGVYLIVNTGLDIPYSSDIFVDGVVAQDLGEELPSLTWTPPPHNLQGLTNLPNGIMAGYVGNTIYFCEPYIPHAWPINYAVTLEHNVVALAALDTTLVALTIERPYFVQGSSPEFMTVVAAGLEQGCSAPRSAVVLNGEVFYVSPDGLIAISPRGGRIVTEQLFSHRQWLEYSQVDNGDGTSVVAASYDLKYFFFSYPQGSHASFIYDIPTGSFTTKNTAASAVFTDLQKDRLYMLGYPHSQSGSGSPNPSERRKMYYFGGTGTAIRPATWTSKIFSFPSEVSFSCIQVEAENYPLTLSVFTDQGTLYTDLEVTSRNLIRLPSVLARDWWVSVNTEHEVFNIALAQSGEELSGA